MLHSSQHIFKSFCDAAQRAGGRDALLYKQKEQYQSITYQDLLKQSVALARILQNHHVGPGEKVVLLLENRPEFACALMAVWACGGVAVPLDIQHSTAQVKSLLKHCEARVVVSQQRFLQLHDEISSGTLWLSVDDPEFKLHLREAALCNQPLDGLPKDFELAALFYTSGTTGEPKAVMLAHSNILSNVHAFHTLKIASDKDVIVSVLPLHHTYAFTTTLLYPLLIGATISYPKSIASADLLSCIKETGATVFVGVPQIFKHMHKTVMDRIGGMKALKRSLIFAAQTLCLNSRKLLGANPGRVFFSKIHDQFGSSLRLMVSGGARLDPEISKDFYCWGFSLIEGYGLTETSPVVAFALPDQVKFGSVGRVLPGVEIRIIGPDEAGIGEVVVRGPNVMKGYYKNSTETARAILDGWFYTGDLGYLDKDGFLFLTGRSKELLILENGENINPDELESYYSQNPFIKEIAIFSFAAERAAEKLVALIVPDQEHFQAQQETNIRGRLKWEMENMCIHAPSYKRVTGLEIFQDGLPRTRLGKLRRFELPQIYARLRLRSQERLDVEKDEPAENHLELFGEAPAYLQETVGRRVGLKEHLELDLGLDSLGRMELLLGLQERLDLHLTDGQAADFFISSTVGELLEKLNKALPKMQAASVQKTFVWSDMLKQDPDKEKLSRINVGDFGFLGKVFNALGWVFFRLFFRLFYRLKVEGAEYVPDQGPFLISSNHSTYFDALLILSALPFKTFMQVFFLGDSKFLNHPVLRPFGRPARFIPIEFTYNMVEALKACAYVLKHKKIVCYFPEGQRSIDGEIKDFRKGIGVLIKELGVAAVPAFISGAFECWPRGQKYPKLFGKITVRFGKMASAEELLFRFFHDADGYEQAAQNLRLRVSELK